MRKHAFVALIVAALAAPMMAQAQTTPPTAPPSAVTALPQPPQPQTPPPPPPPTVTAGRGGRGQTTPPPTVAPGRGGRGQTTPPPSGRGGGGVPGIQGGRGQAVMPNVPSTRGAWQVPAQNIRIELTITDSNTSRSAKKAVSMLLADGHNGRIRSGTSTGTLNVDGIARAGADGRILLELTMEYLPDRAAATAVLNESISVVVMNGQATLVSRSADPASDRSVTLEVVATIVR